MSIIIIGGDQKMKSDKFGLTWQQQVEYNKVHTYGRDVNLILKERKINQDACVMYDIDLTAQELIDGI